MTPEREKQIALLKFMLKADEQSLKDNKDDKAFMAYDGAGWASLNRYMRLRVSALNEAISLMETR